MGGRGIWIEGDEESWAHGVQVFCTQERCNESIQSARVLLRCRDDNVDLWDVPSYDSDRSWERGYLPERTIPTVSSNANLEGPISSIE